MTIEKRERQERIQRLASDLSENITSCDLTDQSSEPQIDPIITQPIIKNEFMSDSTDTTTAALKRHMFRRVNFGIFCFCKNVLFFYDF